MMETHAKKSPRAPSISLQDAIERAIKAYDRERLHEAPTEVVAQNIGYKNANSGTALSTIASLRYFGLLVRPRNGYLAVSKELESFRFAPSDEQRRALLIEFLTTPTLYGELLKKYDSGLPSDATLKYELIQRGFIPAAAETALSSFKQSVAFANFFDGPRSSLEPSSIPVESDKLDSEPDVLPQAAPKSLPPSSVSDPYAEQVSDELDKIPVRLPGGRRAWLLIPAPFFKADKVRLKAQIDLLLAEDDD